MSRMYRILILALLASIARGQVSGSPGVTGGSSSTSTTTASGILKTGLLAEYLLTECSGTTIADSSGSNNGGTFGAQAPTWVNGASCLVNVPYSGLQFLSGSSQFVTLPAALNTARTIYIVTEFNPTINSTVYQAPISSNGTTPNAWGNLFVNQAGGLTGGFAYPFSGAGEYMVEGWAGSARIASIQSAAGINVFAYTLGTAADSTRDQIWVNNNVAPFNAVQPSLQGNASLTGTGQSGGLSTGNYQLGGSASGKLLASFPTFYNGNIYYAAFYSTYQTPSQITANVQAIANLIASRGVQLNRLNSIAGTFNVASFVGDSITWGTGLTTNFPQFMTGLSSQGAWQWVDLGLPSIACQQYAFEANAQIPDSFFWGGGNQVETLWCGTNDIALNLVSGVQAYAYMELAARQHRRHMTGPSKLMPVSMISRVSNDTGKNNFNAPLRQSWQTFGDAFIDIAADPNLGADGASANATYFQGDGIHPTTFAQANDIAPIFQRAINRLYGNNAWGTATTYTVAALAATATTAGSESTNTVTLTFGATPANCVAGNQITIAGVTPAGYNGTYQILTRSATQVTYFDTSGLGAVSVQGTGVCAQQQDADVYTILGGSAVAPAFTMESCVGYTGQNLYFKQTNTTSNWVLTPFQTSETIDGATTLTMPTSTSGNNSVVVLQAQLVSAAAGGCTWKRLQ